MADGGAMEAGPLELVVKDSGKVTGFACGKCRQTTTMMFTGSYLGTDEERLAGARDAAVKHCGPWLCACGSEKRQHWEKCDRCHAADQAEEIEAKERAAFEKAEKVAAKDWGGEYVWSDRFEEVFDSIGELLGRYEDEGEEPPEYVWECEPEKFVLDAKHILESEIESQEVPDGAADHLLTDDQEELQDALDAWLTGHPVKWWRPAYKRAVLLREET
ncbi:hypothetical protein [Sorangium sp. So ce233]|uniref:hypothetical protein n=1 Tax=Sorangium sp. So ce233 TaxID=3133290 RepID=UPI003F6042DA